MKYQVKTWIDRCKEAGLPITRTLVGWGQSHCEWHILEDQRYIDTVIASSSDQNNKIPFMVSPTRTRMIVTPSANGITDESLQDRYNVYNKYDYNRLKSCIDDCVENKTWGIWRGHIYEQQYRNVYDSSFLYGEDSSECGPMCRKDDNYPDEWILPLNHDNLIDMINNENSPYWTTPPMHKRNEDGTLSDEPMESWTDWYPRPGTTLAMIYDLLEYAIDQGVTFMKTQDVLDTFGNLLAFGIQMAHETAADKRLPENDRVGFYCKIGADNSFSIHVN